MVTCSAGSRRPQLSLDPQRSTGLAAYNRPTQRKALQPDSVTRPGAVIAPWTVSSRATRSRMPGVRGRCGRGGGLWRRHLDAEGDTPGLTGLERSDVHDAASDQLAPVLPHLDDHGIFRGCGVSGVPDGALHVERTQRGPDNRTGAADGVEAQVAPAGRARDRAAQDALSAVWAVPRLAHHRRGHSA